MGNWLLWISTNWLNISAICSILSIFLAIVIMVMQKHYDNKQFKTAQNIGFNKLILEAYNILSLYYETMEIQSKSGPHMNSLEKFELELIYFTEKCKFYEIYYFFEQIYNEKINMNLKPSIEKLKEKFDIIWKLRIELKEHVEKQAIIIRDFKFSEIKNPCKEYLDILKQMTVKNNRKK